jgi:Protein of unknown function (DUF2970)
MATHDNGTTVIAKPSVTSSEGKSSAGQSTVGKPVSSSVLGSVKAVAWSFLGIRSAKGYRDDLATVNPLHVVAVGLVGALLFVLGLIATVHWVVAK